MNKQQLAKKIWKAANGMRSKIEASEYKDYILGFIFYKFLSEREEIYLRNEGATPEEIEEIEEGSYWACSVQQNLGYFIEYKNLFSTWVKMGRDFSIEDVTRAISAFNRLIDKDHKKVFENIFNTLETGLSNLGKDATSQTKAIYDLIHLIKIVPIDNKQNYDVLGFIYEYLISNFAANAGKKAGEFYTPHEVSVLMSEIIAEHLKDCDEIKIYDPTSGSGSLLINIGKCISKHIKGENKIKYYAQELKKNTYNLTRMNLVMRGILPANIVTRQGDTLEADWPYFDENDKEGTYEPLTNLDAVVSNPPYSQKWDPEDKQFDPRFAEYGLAPRAKADYAFLLHDLYHLRSGGIMTIVLPHGVLFRGGEEGKIRTALIENNVIDAIIGLPANIFFGTGIPTIVMVLKKGRPNDDVLIVDASKGFVKDGKSNKLRASDIKRIVDTVVKRENNYKYSRRVSRDEIRENEYNLNIPRYVDSSESPESWDVYASMFGGIPNEEIEALRTYWAIFPELKSVLFKALNPAYSAIAVEDIKTAIETHSNVKDFSSTFAKAFADFGEYLQSELIDDIEHVNISQKENDIANNIFGRLSAIPIIDKYEAYQLLDDVWQGVAVDLEIIQTEGFNATRKVDPNMVVKQKDGKEEEVQDGYVGRIVPFELVQAMLLNEEATALTNKNNELAEITSLYSEILENIPEEEKDANNELFSEDGLKFVNAEVVKFAKALSKAKEIYGEDTLEWQIQKVARLIERERVLKREIKADSEQLIVKTKLTIENLTDEQVYELLREKWIEPLILSLNELPNGIINELIAKVSKLANKYTLTLVELESQIKEAEKELSAMIDDLVGDEYDMKGLMKLKTLLGGE